MSAIITGLSNVNKNLKRIVEFGVWHGTTLRIIREFCDTDCEVFGFDSFEGLPEAWEGTDLGKGFFALDENEIPQIENTTLIKGFFEDSLPDFIKKYGHKQCALIHIDCDLYSSTKTILKYMTPSIGSGTIIVFDEWFYNGSMLFNKCEQLAFYEWVINNNIDFDFIPIDNPDRGDCERKVVLIKETIKNFY